MYQEINHYFAYQGMKYIKPEKAGALKAEMLHFREVGQAARKAFAELAKALEVRVFPFKMLRVSNWASQAQLGRPHFWVYFKQPEDGKDDVGIAIRLYGQTDAWGISVEVSFIERQKSDRTLAKQEQVLNLPMTAPLYYFVQEDGVSHRLSAGEENRLSLKEKIASGQVRKVLVKYDLPIEPETSLDVLLEQLVTAFDKLLPYYKQTKEE